MEGSSALTRRLVASLAVSVILTLGLFSVRIEGWSVWLGFMALGLIAGVIAEDWRAIPVTWIGVLATAIGIAGASGSLPSEGEYTVTVFYFVIELTVIAVGFLIGVGVRRLAEHGSARWHQ